LEAERKLQEKEHQVELEKARRNKLKRLSFMVAFFGVISVILLIFTWVALVSSKRNYKWADSMYHKSLVLSIQLKLQKSATFQREGDNLMTRKLYSLALAKYDSARIYNPRDSAIFIKKIKDCKSKIKDEKTFSLLMDSLAIIIATGEELYKNSRYLETVDEYSKAIEILNEAKNLRFDNARVGKWRNKLGSMVLALQIKMDYLIEKFKDMGDTTLMNKYQIKKAMLLVNF
jgi:tetratricopeptide (TPR) repeat protein